MSLLQIGLDISRGIGQANEYQLLRQSNYDANTSMNHLLSTVTSFQLIGTTFNKINIVIRNAKFAEISPIPTYITFSAATFLPFTLTYIKKSSNSTSHPNIHSFVKTLESQILPNLILIANLVASIGLIAFGNLIYGGCNFTFLLLNLLDEQGWFNPDFIQKNPFFTNALLLCKANYLLTSLNLYNVVSLLDLVTTIAYKAACYKKNIVNTIRTITVEEFESKCSGSSLLRCRLSNYHLLETPVSTNSIENLEDQFNEYAIALSSYLERDLSLYHSRLLRIFREDENWENDYNNDSISYLKEGIKGLLLYMQRLTNPKDLKNKFLSLVKYMSNLSEDERVSLLAQLAKIGHYCPERKYIDINLLYDTYIDTIEKRSLSNKILSILHQDRLQILDQILTLLTDEITIAKEDQDNAVVRLVASLIPSFELANFIKKLLSSHLYLHHTSLDTLNGNILSVFEKWFFDIIGAEVITTAKKLFSNQYNSDTVLQRIGHSINNESIISFREIQQWFIDKYRDSFPEATSDEAITWVHSHVYTINDGLLEPRYLLFFLINQGVLELIEEEREAIDATIVRLSPPTRQIV